jgi:hypothetical protein
MATKPLHSVIVLLVLAASAAACVPVSPSPASQPTAAASAIPASPASPAAPVSPAPTAEVATPPPAGPSGQVVWNGSPVPAARLRLMKPGTCREGGPEDVLAAMAADASGRFAFAEPPAGEWQLCVAWPEGKGADAFAPAPLEAGEPVKDVTVVLLKPLQLLAPDPSVPVDLAPTISWEALPEGAPGGYRVFLIDAGTTEALVQQEVAGTALDVTQPLKPGRTYTLVVQALDATKQPIAEVTAELKTAGEPAAPGEESLMQLPASCVREDFPTYVDRSLGLCFAYPQGFALSEDGRGNAEVRGPATGNGPEPLFALLTVESVPYEGQDLQPFVKQYLRANVPDSFPAEVERQQITMGGHAAEVLEPMPGRLSSRTVIVDNAPRSFFVLTFWPSFRDSPPESVNPEGRRAQQDMDALFEIVRDSFATLPG